MSEGKENVLDESALPGKFALFEHFLREADMEAMARTLEEERIPVRRSTEGIRQWRENVIVGQALHPQFWIEIPEGLFARARYLLRELAEDAWSGDAVLEHPFNGYTDDELERVVIEEDHYGIEAAVVARNLLLRRGANVELSALREAYRRRQTRQKAVREGSVWSLLIATAVGSAGAFFLEPFTTVLLSGILAYVAFGRRRAVNGEQSPVYGTTDRRAARTGILIVGGVLLFGLANFLWGHWIPVRPLNAWYWWWR